jgi:hypothetical protein
VHLPREGNIKLSNSYGPQFHYDEKMTPSVPEILLKTNRATQQILELICGRLGGTLVQRPFEMYKEITIEATKPLRKIAQNWNQ